MTTIDPWERATECQRSLKATSNPEQRAILEMLRNLWIALGNTKNLVIKAEISKEVETIDRIHADVVSANGSTLHEAESLSGRCGILAA